MMMLFQGKTTRSSPSTREESDNEKSIWDKDDNLSGSDTESVDTPKLSAEAKTLGLDKEETECPYCQENTKARDLDAHINKDHLKKSVSTFGCSLCDHCKDSLKSAMAHLKRNKTGCKKIEIRSVKAAKGEEETNESDSGDEDFDDEEENEDTENSENSSDDDAFGSDDEYEQENKREKENKKRRASEMARDIAAKRLKVNESATPSPSASPTSKKTTRAARATTNKPLITGPPQITEEVRKEKQQRMEKAKERMNQPDTLACPHCPEITETFDKMVEHQDNKHKHVTRRSYHCSLCKENLRFAKETKSHLYLKNCVAGDHLTVVKYNEEEANAEDNLNDSDFPDEEDYADDDDDEEQNSELKNSSSPSDDDDNADSDDEEKQEDKKGKKRKASESARGTPAKRSNAKGAVASTPSTPTVEDKNAKGTPAKRSNAKGAVASTPSTPTVEEKNADVPATPSTPIVKNTDKDKKTPATKFAPIFMNANKNKKPEEAKSTPTVKSAKKDKKMTPEEMGLTEKEALKCQYCKKSFAKIKTVIDHLSKPVKSCKREEELVNVYGCSVCSSTTNTTWWKNPKEFMDHHEESNCRGRLSIRSIEEATEAGESKK